MVLAAVAPVLSYFYVDANLLGSRYLYLAQAGWVLILVAILETASDGRKAIFLPVLAILLGAWFVAGTMHIELWTEAARAATGYSLRRERRLPTVPRGPCMASRQRFRASRCSSMAFPRLRDRNWPAASASRPRQSSRVNAA